MTRAILLLTIVPAVLFAANKKAPASKAPVTPPRPVSFRLDVMPVFFRAGCNSGGCHGAASGKDGFRLSLFGYDPAGDYFRLTQQLIGRRIDLAVPEESLLLKKATGMVPHSGGRRFKPDSGYYRTVLEWIRAGAPADSEKVPQVAGISLVPDKIVFSGKEPKKKLQVIARYSDGTTRTVNNLALYLTNNKNTADIDDNGIVTAGKRGATFVFARFAKFTTGAEVIVLPTDKNFKWPKVSSNNYIDDIVNAKLQYLRILPSSLSTDEQFLRRVSIDLIGLLPTVDEYKSFVADRSPGKRAKLVDALMQRDEFADLWATKWAELLKVITGNNASFGTDRKVANAYYQWIREQMKRNTPVDEFVRAQLAGTGSNIADPAVNLYTMIPQGRYDAKEVALDVAEVFTGIRIQCAQCHNHPFDRWTMDDFYGFVSFFTGVKRKPASEPREYYISGDPNPPPAKYLLDNRPVPAKFLGGAEPDIRTRDPRLALAEWLTSTDNVIFRQNIANRVWDHFFGRGIVHPVDDVRISNPPSNKELLEALGKHLASYNYDVRRLILDICTSRTYQLSSIPNETNRDDDSQFSHAKLRRMRADVMLDALAQVTGTPTAFGPYAPGTRATEMFEGGHRTGNYFLRTFGLSKRESVHASETRYEPTLSQALHLINGDTVETKIARSTIVTEQLKAKRTPQAIIEVLYIRTLSRKPSAEESKKLAALVANDPSGRAVYDDILWALINSSEFEFNH
ncbi:MAG: DUF1549 domain-containing protein [Acidobacteria bacterium]|nr:DUF1549 domain-containing protein [Acidobacteriota bacterium]